MALFHLLLSFITVFFASTAFYFVWFAPDLLYHFYFGLVATIAALVTHCWVFFYFIGTGEGIREGILENNLDASPIKLTKKFKGMTFPFALFSMIFLIVASILGGALRFHRVSIYWHLGFVYFGLAFNLFSFWQENRVIRRNAKLMDELNAKVDAQEEQSV
ncbi:MAG: hypothetical protein H7A33_05475 [Deltaproteobacteria bacterium]|nr:hypothetical protein [Deltaproteobacteria bacterium]